MNLCIQCEKPTVLYDQSTAKTYTYDSSDNIISVTERNGQTTTFTYDPMNRITLAEYADGSFTTYQYDAAGRIATISDTISGVISYTYTDSGCSTGTCGGTAVDRLASETTPQGTINYSYDAIGRRTIMTVAGQPAVNYSYDANSRLTSIDTIISGATATFSLGYDTIGRRTTLTLPNGVTTNYSYDNASRLSNLQHVDSSNNVLESLSYTYDADGNRLSMNRQNVTTVPLPNLVTSATYNDANQMLIFTPQTGSAKNITYDLNGNMISVTNSCGTTTYTCDARNRLVGINGYNSDCSALTASFKYDALGRRFEKTTNNRTIQYLYDRMDIAEEIESGAVGASYIRTLNIDEPLARIKADGTLRYYQRDALGSVIALTDSTEAIKTQYVYDPFGSTTVIGEGSDNPFQYTGRESDGTGLIYYRARYYSPEIQRFISEDPIGFEGGINFFAYVRNNSLNRNDPNGEIGLPEIAFGIGTLAWIWYTYYDSRHPEDPTQPDHSRQDSVIQTNPPPAICHGSNNRSRNPEHSLPELDYPEPAEQIELPQIYRTIGVK